MFDSNLPEDTRSATFSFNVVWHADRSWLKVVAVEVRLEEPVSGRDAQQRTAPDPDFPHEIDGDLAD